MLPSYLTNSEVSYPSILKVAISSNPSIKDQDCITYIISTWDIAFFSSRVGEDDEWTLVDGMSSYDDVIYFKVNFCDVDANAQTFMFNSLFEKVAIINHQ